MWADVRHVHSAGAENLAELYFVDAGLRAGAADARRRPGERIFHHIGLIEKLRDATILRCGSNDATPSLKNSFRA